MRFDDRLVFANGSSVCLVRSMLEDLKHDSNWDLYEGFTEDGQT